MRWGPLTLEHSSRAGGGWSIIYGGMPEAEGRLSGWHRIAVMEGRQKIRGRCCCTRCMLYSVCAILGVCCTRCMLYSVYAVLGVCCSQCMLYSVYAVFGVCCTQCMLYSVYAVLGVCCTQHKLMLVVLREIQEWISCVLCDGGRVVDEKERCGMQMGMIGRIWADKRNLGYNLLD